jgi:hypothetical protein
MVQCKGFEVHDWEIGDSQLLSRVASIEKSRRSALRAHTYLLVHNRTGKGAEFRVGITNELARLVADGIVERAELWTWIGSSRTR